MNLAVRDIRHNFGRFALTTLGVGLLLMIVMGMGGIYRGLIEEATLLSDRIGADIWVVQGGTRGPFAEISRVPRSLVDRVAAVGGVESAREFVTNTIQRMHNGVSLRMAVVGLSWPTDKGQWLPLEAGRSLARNHYEIIADRAVGLRLGDAVRLGKDVYTVVGITRGMTDVAGNGTVFVTVNDALSIQFDVPGEAIRLERAARRGRGEQLDFGRAQPSVLERASGPASQIPALARPPISAVMARLAPGADPSRVVAAISAWGDVSAITHDAQRELLLQGVVERSRRQLGLFRALLTIISTIIMALILYTLTLDKLHDIAVLKLIGAPNRVVLGLILQQALLLGILGYGVAYVLGQKVYPLFPRRVVLANQDLIQLAGVVLGISVLASLLGIWRAMRVAPNQALAG